MDQEDRQHESRRGELPTCVNLMKLFTKNVIDFIKKYSVTQHIINYYNLKVQYNLNYVESAIKS